MGTSKIRNPFLIILLLITILNRHWSQYSCAEIEKKQTGLRTINAEKVNVGMILDMESREGKIINNSIFMAVSDFYSLHPNYSSRLVLHTRDSKGVPLLAQSAALELFYDIKVEAFVGGETKMEAKLLAEFGNRVKVPVLSLYGPSNISSPISSNSYTTYPFLIQISQDETLQFKGMVSIVQAFKWRDIILVHDVKDFETEMIKYATNLLQEKNINIAYTIEIGTKNTDELMIEKLHKLTSIEANKVFIVHISSVDLLSRLLLNAKKLGFMSEGYAWLMTLTTMNLLHHIDFKLIQGVLGFKPYIPKSKQYIFNMEVLTKSSIYGIWAYDSTWALAEAVERAKLKFNKGSKPLIVFPKYSSLLLNEIFKSRFMGLSGEVQFINGKLLSVSDRFELVNVIGKVKRRVGFWRSTSGKESFRGRSLEAIIWPGGSTIIPKGRFMSVTNLRIGVPVKEGFKELVRVDYDPYSNEVINITGFCIDVFKAAVKYLPYNVEYEFIPIKNATGRYNELIYQVYLQNYDGIVGDTTITSNRSNYVDFTVTYTDIGVAIITKNEKTANKSVWIFLRPFSTDLWITTAAFFVITGIIVWVIERPINQEFQGSLSHQLGNLLWFSFSTLVFAQREKLVSNLSKFVTIVWIFVVLILTSSYTATLTSMMTVQQIKMTSFWDGLAYQIQGRPYTQLTTPEQYVKALSQSDLKPGGVLAIMSEMPYIKLFLSYYPQDYSMIKSIPSTNGFGFVFAKGMPIVHDMSIGIMKLREEGEITRMEDKWFRSNQSNQSPVSSPSPDSSNPNVLHFNSFRGLFLISGISSSLALSFFLLFFMKEKLIFVKKYYKLEHLRVLRMYIHSKLFHVNEEHSTV